MVVGSKSVDISAVKDWLNMLCGHVIVTSIVCSDTEKLLMGWNQHEKWTKQTCYLG